MKYKYAYSLDQTIWVCINEREEVDTLRDGYNHLKCKPFSLFLVKRILYLG